MKQHEQIQNRRNGRQQPGDPGARPVQAVAARRSTSRTQDIDRYVGARIRERRIMLGLTQQQLADALRTTRVSVARYEAGMRRIPGVSHEALEVYSLRGGDFLRELRDFPFYLV